MKIKVEAFREDWAEVKKAALVTVHKKTLGSNLTGEWKEAMCLGRHSPIREFRIKVLVEDIPRWVADQLVRHNVGVNNFMGTGRSDRGNKPRAEQTMEDLTVFKQSFNIESFTKFCNTRLCVGSVSKQTRELVEQIVREVREVEPQIAEYCVPPCISSLYCKEAKLRKMTGLPECNHLRMFMKYNLSEYMEQVVYTNPDDRFQAYKIFRDEN